MFSLFFVSKLLTTLVNGQESPSETQFSCFPDYVSKEESFLSCFESDEEALLDCMRQWSESSARQHKYASSYDPLVQCLLEASGRIKSKLCQRLWLVAMTAIGDNRA